MLNLTSCRRVEALEDELIASEERDLQNPAKRSLQRAVLGRIMRHPHRRDPMTVVCMPSKSCWDIDYFSAYEKSNYRPVKKIWAIERDPETAEHIRRYSRNNPLVEVFEGSTARFFDETDAKFDLVYLDYFSNFNLSVANDIRVMLRRDRLVVGGKCIVNLYAARESDADQVMHKHLFEDLVARVDAGELWSDIDADRRRCIAFNALIASFRFTPVRPLPRGHVQRSYVTTTAPIWSRYRSGNASMLTGYFTLNKATERHTTLGAIQVARDVWFVRNNWEIKDYKHSKSLVGLAKTEGKAAVRSYWKRMIQNYYDTHGYTPRMNDLGRQHVRGYMSMVRELKLCPSQDATLDEIKLELQRIAKRDGVVTRKALKRARITRKHVLTSVSANSVTALRILMDELRIKHEFTSKALLSKYKRRKEVLSAWLSHIEAGHPNTKFRHYGLVCGKWKVLTYELAARELRVAETWLSENT